MRQREKRQRKEKRPGDGGRRVGKSNALAKGKHGGETGPMARGEGDGKG